ncbi:hypothetical protein [Bradyrhizobium arachidis]|uniref:Peptidase M28 domain-containing protein n=1 Tax=Bradyrhizobium arachidis TaxID=858423 RepID=A0AAE7TJT6_9BRAD|nr:hypothetical protein [Bradyrhizobium arachidis]QOZ71378.1 hypothetical protein WN72_37660 [Bradyrhizobium arachidis]SFU50254.1 hypothetical protein SAMN05192541_102314 [Bradyrhizobium arachidis]
MRRILIAAMAVLMVGQAAAKDVLSGARLYEDVTRYASFSLHRFGSPGDRATADWIAGEMKQAGFDVSFQPVVLGRQYVVEQASVDAGGTRVEATPFWWPPEDKASFHLTAPLARDGDVAGKILLLDLPFDRGAYLGPAHRAAISEAAAKKPTGILLTIGNPADDRFAYNVTQEDTPWPVPVIVVGARSRPTLERALASGAPVTLDVKGHYERDVAGRNVIAAIGTGPTIVVSTPMTGWYSCVCERGPGIANFLALARTVAAEKWPAHFVFIATAGHEIGHGGMELFLKHGAPATKETLAWIHFGSSNACYAFAEGARTDRPEEERYLVLSKSAVALTDEAFARVDAKRLVTEKQAVGELRDVHAAGYANFLGMAGRHRTFHTPSDDLAATGADILEPVARAFVDAARKIVERGEAAFR